jgi:predicted GNAT superfamily acetyltransferase
VKQDRPSGRTTGRARAASTSNNRGQVCTGIEAQRAQLDRVVVADRQRGGDVGTQLVQLAPAQISMRGEPRIVGKQLGRGDVVVAEDLAGRQVQDLVQTVMP